MEIVVRRLIADEDTTLGVLEVDGYKCCTLEDEFRDIKVPGETRIPAGRYQILKRIGSKMARRYDERFGAWHNGMLWLQDVPGFEWVYIHVGNDDDDTSGCILVGKTLNPNNMTVQSSVAAYSLLYRQISNAIMEGRSVFITVGDD